MNKLLHGDCLHELQSLPTNSIDLLCTDPPYGYGFMGKEWDRAIPSVEIWRQCLRVLKPGAFAFILCAPRQDLLSQMIRHIGSAGFVTSFTSLYWCYASGFPKSLNIAGAIARRSGARRVGPPRIGAGSRGNTFVLAPEYRERRLTGRAKELAGAYGGFQPKPAVEVVIVAMKPLSKKTFAAQALDNGKGVTWLDDARIPYRGEVPNIGGRARHGRGDSYGFTPQRDRVAANDNGRFAANFIVGDQALGPQFSRYFSVDAWAETLPVLCVPKPSKKERNYGLQDCGERARVGSPSAGGGGSNETRADRVMTRNPHPTVKPLRLMCYLITLGSRPGDVVLDPFLGSGTTALGANLLGRGYVGIERERQYLDVARARLGARESSRMRSRLARSNEAASRRPSVRNRDSRLIEISARSVFCPCLGSVRTRPYRTCRSPRSAGRFPIRPCVRLPAGSAFSLVP